MVSICESNLRNLGKIASKLFVKLKIQFVYSMILCHLDYCNALFHGLPACMLRRLTKVLYAGLLVFTLFLGLNILNDVIIFEETSSFTYIMLC